MHEKSSSSSLVSIPNEMRTDLWLFSTTDADRSVRLYVGFPGSELSPSFCQDADVSLLQTDVLLFNDLFEGNMTKFSWRKGSYLTSSVTGNKAREQL